MRVSLRATVVLAVFLHHPGAVWAQASNADRVLAETLFEEGQRLLDESKTDEACAKLEESQRLDPATGTLLNLAYCHELQGKLATAWTEYKEAQTAARQDGRDDRVKFAAEHLAAIEPKMPRLQIEVAQNARVEGLEVKLDGVQIGEAAFGVAAPLDPGVHIIVATAPGRVRWVQQARLYPDGTTQTVVIDELERESSAAADPGSETASQAGNGDSRADRERAPAAASADHSDASATWPAWVSAVVTAGCAGGATYTGIKYLSRRDVFISINNDPRYTFAQKADARDRAYDMMLANAVLTGVTAVGTVVTTALFWATWPTDDSAARYRAPRVQAGPWVSDRAVGLGLGGTL
jgi:hypothetical protein